MDEIISDTYFIPEALDPVALARGIAVILNATLMGLLIAIPSLVFWSYYSKKVEMLTVEMETVCDEFVRRQYRSEEVKSPKSEARSLKSKV